MSQLEQVLDQDHASITKDFLRIGTSFACGFTYSFLVNEGYIPHITPGLVSTDNLINCLSIIPTFISSSIFYAEASREAHKTLGINSQDPKGERLRGMAVSILVGLPHLLPYFAGYMVAGSKMLQ